MGETGERVGMPDHGYELMADGKPVGRGAVELQDCGYVWIWDMPCGGSQAGTADSEAQAWKKAAGVGADKATSLARATMRWPDLSDLWRRKKDDGRAEAALIGWHGWERFA